MSSVDIILTKIANQVNDFDAFYNMVVQAAQNLENSAEESRQEFLEIYEAGLNKYVGHPKLILLFFELVQYVDFLPPSNYDRLRSTLSLFAAQNSDHLNVVLEQIAFEFNVNDNEKLAENLAAEQREQIKRYLQSLDEIVAKGDSN